MPAESFRAVRALDARAPASAGWTMLILALESASEAREQTKRDFPGSSSTRGAYAYERRRPEAVKSELEGFVDCGVLARGFCVLACPQCRERKVVAFSCKSRAFCPSCGGRRMTSTAADLVDAFPSKQCLQVSALAARQAGVGLSGYPFPDAGVGPQDVNRSANACLGAAPGLYDMSGNVAEWEDSCNGSTGSGDDCRVRGGSYPDGSAALECKADKSLKRDAKLDDVGFRCCFP
jgi:hypothetical protein